MTSGQGILVYDVNAPWRERVFQELGTLRPVVGVAPQRLNCRGKQSFREIKTLKGYQRLTVPVLPGWSRTLYRLHRSRLWLAGHRALTAQGAEVGAVVLTIPHHWPLLSIVDAGIKKIYYCPDFYPAYEGWDSDWVRKIETAIVRAADGIICVSQALHDHVAALDHGITEKVWLSPNGVDEEFLGKGPACTPEESPRVDLEGRRPLIGCVGVFNDRIDYPLLHELVRSFSGGALVLVGPLEPLPPCADEWRRRLLAHPRVIAVGPQPHASLPQWMRAMDVLIIPYTKSIFNYMCSPMRLFDYLSSGRPIVANLSCKQVIEHNEYTYVGENITSFINNIDCALQERKEECYIRWEFAKSSLWSHRALHFDQIIDHIINN